MMDREARRRTKFPWIRLNVEDVPAPSVEVFKASHVKRNRHSSLAIRLLASVVVLLSADQLGWANATMTEVTAHNMLRIRDIYDYACAFENYGLNMQIAELGVSLGGNCLGMAQTLCDAQAYELTTLCTPEAVVKHWVEKRQMDVVNLLSDVVENRRVSRDHYVNYNFGVICDWLNDGRYVPVVLIDDDAITMHAVVVYAVTRFKRSGNYNLFYYDPESPPDFDKKNYGWFTYNPDRENLPFYDRYDCDYSDFSNTIELDPTHSKLIYISNAAGGNFDRFFPVQKYAPRFPDNGAEWDSPSKLGTGECGD